MLWYCGATIAMLALMPVWVCDVGKWHACPTFTTRTSAWVLLPASIGLAVIALDKAVCKVLKTIACLPCSATKACAQRVCGTTDTDTI